MYYSGRVVDSGWYVDYSYILREEETIKSAAGGGIAQAAVSTIDSSCNKVPLLLVFCSSPLPSSVVVVSFLLSSLLAFGVLINCCVVAR